MKEQCYDEGTIQAFLDGELNPERLEQVARHVSFCDECAFLLQETEEEASFAFAALDDEFNSLVPTERIRTNLYQAISEIEKPKVSFWEKLADWRFLFANPSITAFAGLLIVAGLFAVVWKYNSQNFVSTVETARVVTSNQATQKIADAVPPSRNIPSAEAITINAEPSKTDAPKPRFAKATSEDLKPKYQNLKYSASRNARIEERKPAADTGILSGEETYLKTIATLKKTVDGSKDMVLSPSARVAYEKDMAMVNDAISKMKAEVRKNPKNEVAKEVLRTSYQNKIDLLNSVAERSETLASLD